MTMFAVAHSLSSVPVDLWRMGGSRAGVWIWAGVEGATIRWVFLWYVGLVCEIRVMWAKLYCERSFGYLWVVHWVLANWGAEILDGGCGFDERGLGKKVFVTINGRFSNSYVRPTQSSFELSRAEVPAEGTADTTRLVRS